MRCNRITSRSIAVAAVACVAIVLPGAVEADEQQEFRCPKPGTVIEFTEGGGKVTFTGQDGMWCIGTNSSGQSWRRYALLAGSDSRLIENHVERIWPLQIGKEITFTLKSTPNSSTGGIAADTPFWYKEKFVAVRTEKVTVQAGTFDTWVIEAHEDVARGGFSSIATYWYAPEVGYAVKYSYHIALGIGKDNAFEAKAISLTATTVATPTPAQSPSPTIAPLSPSTPPVAAPSKAPAAITPSGSATSGATAQRLQELKDLLERKLITPSEYEAKRKAILDAL